MSSSPEPEQAPTRHLRRTFSQGNRSEEELVKRAVVWEAFSRGMWGGLYGTIVGGAAMWAANKYNWMGVRKGLSVSGKTGLVVTAAVTPFWIRSEMTLVEGQQNPERFMVHPAHADTGGHSVVQLPLWQRGLNFMYDNPMQTWAMIALPAYGAIFAYESSNPVTAAMPLSQRILHTRVYGQFTALSVLLGVGLTTDTMRKGGGKFEPVDLQELGADHPVSRASKQSTQAMIDGISTAKDAKQSGPNWGLLVPLVYAPLFPLIRIGLRNRVTKRQLDLLTGGTIALALTHAGVIMASDSTVLG